MSFKPMLAVEAVLDKVMFPALVSAKLDGIRAIVIDGKVMSRNMKPIPNKYVRHLFGRREYQHLDGELIVGDPAAKDVYRQTSSGVMSVDGEPDVQFYLFDHITNPQLPYQKRAPQRPRERAPILPQHLVLTMDDLLKTEQLMLDAGYEGLMIRHPDAPYKYGRSTVKEGWLLKLKRFQDAEATIVGFEERMHNGNEATTDELGRTKRSSHQAGKTGRGDLGALVCDYNGVRFTIGTGFTDVERANIWAERDQYLGKLAKFKFFPVGVKEAPRFPVFLGFRDRRDL